jgi:hypothetical protein
MSSHIVKMVRIMQLDKLGVDPKKSMYCFNVQWSSMAYAVHQNFRGCWFRYFFINCVLIGCYMA